MFSTEVGLPNFTDHCARSVLLYSLVHLRADQVRTKEMMCTVHVYYTIPNKGGQAIPSESCPGFLSLYILLAATKTAQALFQASTNRSSSRVTAPDASLVFIKGLRWDDAWCVVVVDAPTMAVVSFHLSA